MTFVKDAFLSKSPAHVFIKKAPKKVPRGGPVKSLGGPNKNALVKAVLTEAGQKISDGVAEQKTVSKHSMKRNERDAILAEDDSFLLAA